MRALVEDDVRPPEAVDGLLGIADEEEPARVDLHLVPRRRCAHRLAAGDERGDLDLQRIGVLKLIDQQVRELLAQAAPHRRVATQEVACLHEQVVELEPALAAALVRVGEDELARRVEQRGQHRIPHLLDQRVALPLGLFQAVADLLHRHAEPAFLASGRRTDPESFTQHAQPVELVLGGGKRLR